MSSIWAKRQFSGQVKYLTGAHEYTIRKLTDSPEYYVEHLHDGFPITRRDTLREAKDAADELAADDELYCKRQRGSSRDD